jgi:hypothetical protein
MSVVKQTRLGRTTYIMITTTIKIKLKNPVARHVLGYYTITVCVSVKIKY